MRKLLEITIFVAALLIIAAGVGSAAAATGLCARSAAEAGSPAAPKPLGASNRDFGGWSWRWRNGDDGFPVQVWAQQGLPTTGLLMKTWGCITEVDSSRQCFYIDDGSCLTDYARAHVGMKVLLGPGTLSVGEYVTVVGISATQADSTTGDPLPAIRPRTSSDIQLF